MVEYKLEEEAEFSPEPKRTLKDWIKFYLIPGWRDPKFTKIERVIYLTKSKRKLFRRLLKPLIIAGFVMVFFIFFCAVYGPIFTPYTIYQVTDFGVSGTGSPFELPSPEHPLGTTSYGYDILARLMWGARTAVTFSLVTIIIASLGGIVVGTISAYLGGRWDFIIMRIVDIIMVLPNLVIVILITQMIGPRLDIILYTYGAFAIPWFSRLMRSSVLQVKQDLYIEAAKTGGAKKFRIMFVHIIPNAISPILISFFGGVGASILGFSSIAFLGFGDQTVSDWGSDILYARARFSGYYAALWPGLFILIAILGFMLVGDGLRDALDPRLRLS